MSTHFINWLSETYPLDSSMAQLPNDDESISFIAPLIDYSVIRVSGIDAEKFMQGQFSCDVREVNEEQSRLGTANTPKGRAYAVFRIAKQGSDYLIRLPTEIAQDFFERLNKYIVFSKATLTKEENVCVLGMVGEVPPLNSISQLPTEVDGSVNIDNNMIIKVPSTRQPRYEIWCDVDYAKSLLTPRFDQSPQLKRYTQADWNWSEVCEGIAEVYSQTQESFIPQMLNLQHLKAISFKKGCYTGQEIIARMKYLGKLKKEMFLLSTPELVNTSPGEPVFEQNTDKKVGSVVRTVRSNINNTTLTLAVLDIESTKTDVVFSLSKSSSQAAQLLPLSYENGADN